MSLTQQLNDNAVYVKVKCDCYTGCFKRPNTDIEGEVAPEMISGGSLRLFVPGTKGGDMPEAPESWKTCKLVKSRLQATLEQFAFPFMEKLAWVVPINKFLACDAALGSLIVLGNDAADTFATDDYPDALDAGIRYYRERASVFGLTPDEMEAWIRKYTPIPTETTYRGEFSLPVQRKFNFRQLAFEFASPTAINQIDAVLAKEKAEEIGRNLEAQTSDVITEIMQSVIGELKQGFENMLTKADQGKWNQKTFTSMTKLIDKVREGIAFLDYDELTASIETFKQNVLNHEAKEYKADKTLRETIRASLQEQITHLEELSESDKQEVIDRFGAQGKRRVKIN